MCLNVDVDEPTVATEDIVCYKVLHLYEMEIGFHSKYGKIGTPYNRMLLSPYHGYRYYDDGNGMSIYPAIALGELHTLPKPIKARRRAITGKCVVNDGFHTFKRREDAEVTAAGLGELSYDHFVLACIIPKGAMFFDGWFVHDGSYASDQLIVLPLDDPRALRCDGMVL